MFNPKPFSTADLKAIQANNYQGISTPALKLLQSQGVKSLADITGNSGVRTPATGNSLINFFKGGAQGIDSLAEGGLTAVEKGLNSILPNSYQIPYPPKINAFSQDPQDANTISANIGNIVGQTIPFLAAPETSGLSTMGRVGANTALGAGMGVANAEYNDTNPLVQGAIGGVTGGLMGEIGHGIGKLFSPNANSTPASQVSNFIDTAQRHNIKPDIGTVTNNPILNNLYNFSLAKVPGSGVIGNQSNTLGQISNLTNNIMTNLSDNVSPGDIPSVLKSAVQGNKDSATEANSALFNKVKSGFDDNNITFSPDDLQNTIKTGANIANENALPLSVLGTLPSSLLSSIQDLTNKTITSDIKPSASPITNTLDNSAINNETSALPTENNFTFNNCYFICSRSCSNA